MMENGPFSEVWKNYEERLSELAKEMAKDARKWAEENHDLLTEQARYLKKADLPNVANTTHQMTIQFDFSGIRTDGPGYSISHAGKQAVSIPLPYVNFQPNDDRLGDKTWGPQTNIAPYIVPFQTVYRSLSIGGREPGDYVSRGRVPELGEWVAFAVWQWWRE